MTNRILNPKNIIFILLLIYFTIHFKIFENTYIILISNYEKRLTHNYGYCEKNSYGFIKYIEKKYQLKKNIKIFNDEIYPRSDGFIYKPKTEFLNNQIILINYNNRDSSVDMDKYKVIEKLKNCYYLELK